MSKELVPVESIQTMARAVASSKLFGIANPDQAMALMLIAQAEGMHPAIAARDYHVIQGRPALKADAMLARFQAAGGKVQWKEYTDEAVSAVFSHPNGGSVEIDWTMERAKAAGLTGKDSWRKYPRQMLRARVISEGIRTVFPGVAVGVYTPEEVQDFDEPRRAEPEVIDVTPKADAKVATPKATDGATEKAKAWAAGATAEIKTLTSAEEISDWERGNSGYLSKLKNYPEHYERLRRILADMKAQFVDYTDAAE